MPVRALPARLGQALLVLVLVAGLALLAVGTAPPAAAEEEPSISVSDVRVVEGDSGYVAMEVTVTGYCPAAGNCSIQGSPAPDSATDGSDVSLEGGDYGFDYWNQPSYFINPGSPFSATRVVHIKGDTKAEADETFTFTATLTFNDPAGRAPASDTSTVTIVDDDGAPPPPASGTIVTVSGDGQTAPPGTTFAQPLVARVADSAGRPLSGVPVTFSVTSRPGLAWFPPSFFLVLSVVSVTGPDGTATSPPLSAVNSGPVTVKAHADVAAGVATFTETVLTPTFTAVAGDGQTAAPGAPFAQRLAVRVTDPQGRPLSGIHVRFTGPSGPAAFSGIAPGYPTVIISGADGIATAPELVAGSTPGTVTVRAGGIDSAATVVFTATVQAAPPPAWGADVRTTVSAPATAAPGAPVSVRLTVTNTGPATAAALGATLSLPAGTYPVSLGGGIPLPGGRLFFGRPSLGANQSVTFSVTVRTTPGTRGTVSFTGTAHSFLVPDPDTANNTGSAPVTVPVPG